MKGWAKDGTEVELQPWQELLVRALLSRQRVTLPERGRGFGWSVVLATAARMDAEGIAVHPLTRAEADLVPGARDAWFAMHPSAPRPRKVAVIAGSYDQFLHWCREQAVSPHSPDVLYATPESLRGRSDLEVRRVGTWAERRDLAEIENVLRYVNRQAASAAAG
jgi:hypothetical protein